ncbi:MAG: hypothetical protein NWF00_05055 [Candidatus Bathyarchaeota archaeon]|nr:hypothetical protein [Candidatus Bathyarchaeota archaeon]
MFQPLTVKTTLALSRSKLTLNVPTIQQLLPSLECGDFAVFYGGASASYLTSLLCVKVQLPSQIGGLSSRAVFVDGGGGNTFRLYQISKIAQRHSLNPTAVLKKISVTRAFTAYQMTSLIMGKLCEAVDSTEAPSSMHLSYSQHRRIIQSQQIQQQVLLLRKASSLRGGFSAVSVGASDVARFFRRLRLMGKTVESYRMALEEEIGTWKGFARDCESTTKKPSMP